MRLRPLNQRICPLRSSRSAWSISSMSSSSSSSSSGISSFCVPWPAVFRNFSRLVGIEEMIWMKERGWISSVPGKKTKCSVVQFSSLPLGGTAPLLLSTFVLVQVTGWLQEADLYNRRRNSQMMLTCPQSRHPKPKKTHHSHCSILSPTQLNGFPPNCTITIWGGKCQIDHLLSSWRYAQITQAFLIQEYLLFK